MANVATTLLEEIYTQATDSLSKNQEMSLSSKTQAHNVSGLAVNVDAIAQMSQSTNYAMEENVQAVKELMNISKDLQKLMDHFKV
jgi:methyl-accepting chemotaxis protein